jgi:hypothetical protein
MALVPALWLTMVGLFQLYVSAIFVEKYYTQFWIAVWNIFDSVLVFAGLIFDAIEVGNELFVWVTLAILVLSLVSLICGLEGPSAITTTVGSSLFMSSLGLAGILLFACPDALLAGVVFVANLVLVFSMKIGAVSRGKHRESRRRYYLQFDYSVTRSARGGFDDGAELVWLIGFLITISVTIGALIDFARGAVFVPAGLVGAVVALWLLNGGSLFILAD